MTTSWSNQSKNAATFSNQSLNSASWANQSKITPDFLLMESSDVILMETGDRILLESSKGGGWSNQTKN